MDKLPLAPSTSKAVQAFLKKPSSVLILHGSSGVGKLDLSQLIMAEVLGVSNDKLISYPYIVYVEPTKDSISIDSIREMQKSLVRSVPGEAPIRRAVLIADAQKLTNEAQNALLKSLEEPPIDTIFILTVDNLHQLLSTVVSRSRQLAVLPLDEDQAVEEFGETAEVKKAYHMSSGRADLMRALLNDDEHPLISTVEEAKSLLQKSTYERLLLVNNLAKDKPATENMLDALLLLARISLTTSVKNQRNDQAKRWHAITKQVTAAKKALNGNAGTKLVLTDLFLHL